MHRPTPATSTIQRPAPSAATIRTWRRISRFTQQGWVGDFLHQLERELMAPLLDARGDVAASPPSPSWLLRYRPQIRRIADRQPTAAIRLYLLTCPTPMRPIAVALLGHCAERTNTCNLLEYAATESAPTRRRAARALWRAEAWSKLRSLITASPDDDRVAFYGRIDEAKRSFGDRLHAFAEHVDHSHEAEAAGPSRMALWFAELDWVRRPPKSIELMRRILNRIHRLVHGA
jgi:hypothetical protein